MRLPVFPLIGAVALLLVPPSTLQGDPAKLLMPFLGLMMAGIFPAISLTINTLKSGGFSVQRVNDLADELHLLLNYLQALFAVSLVAALTLVTAETLHWGANFFYPAYTARIFNLVLGACLGVLLGSLPNLRRTLATLLQIAREIAVDEAATKLRDRARNVSSIVDRFPTKEKFGELFDVEGAKKAE
ncbi:MAG TPA: hypothetical protein VIT45_12430 [Allosphingosinicella sp.]